MVTCQGDKILLRETTPQDIDTLYYWKFEEKNQEAKKWNGPYIPETFLTKEAYKESWESSIDPILHVPDSLVIDVNGVVIGTVSFYWVDKNTNWLETGIVIYDPSYWNGGYGSEAFALWIDFLFQSTSLHRLGISTWSGNDRMIKVAARVGMKEEARIRDARMVEGIFYDAIKMGILRSEWQQSNGSFPSK